MCSMRKYKLTPQKGSNFLPYCRMAFSCSKQRATAAPSYPSSSYAHARHANYRTIGQRTYLEYHFQRTSSPSKRARFTYKRSPRPNKSFLCTWKSKEVELDKVLVKTKSQTMRTEAWVECWNPLANRWSFHIWQGHCKRLFRSSKPPFLKGKHILLVFLPGFLKNVGRHPSSPSHCLTRNVWMWGRTCQSVPKFRTRQLIRVVQVGSSPTSWPSGLSKLSCYYCVNDALKLSCLKLWLIFCPLNSRVATIFQHFFMNRFFTNIAVYRQLFFLHLFFCLGLFVAN